MHTLDGTLNLQIAKCMWMHVSKTFHIFHSLSQVKSSSPTWVRSMELPAAPYTLCCSTHNCSQQGQLCPVLMLRQLCLALRLLPRSQSWEVVPPFPGSLTLARASSPTPMIQTPEKPEPKDILDYKNYKYFCYLTLSMGYAPPPPQKNHINLEVWKGEFQIMKN